MLQVGEIKPSQFRPVILSLELCLISRKFHVVPKPKHIVILSVPSPIHGDFCLAVLFLSGL